MRRVIGIFLFCCVNLASAQFSTPVQGEYVSDGGWGTLKVDASGKFQIESMGANGHSCSLGGLITHGKSVIDKSACVVTFRTQGQGVEVATNETGDCRLYCGMGASFDTLYIKAPAPCLSDAVKRSRANFKTNYQAKNYAAALNALSGIAKQCKPFLFWIDSAWVLNDLALTQFKLGDRASCMRTLQSLAGDAAMSDEEIRETYPPTDADMYLPVLRATRTNLKLCKTP